MVLVHEGSKFHECMIEKRDLINRDEGARVETVCTDPYKISRYGHRFGDGCKGARDSVDKGIIMATTDCFIAKHNIYKILSFEHAYFNYALVAGTLVVFLFTLLMIKNYYVQVASIRATSKTHREFLDVFQNAGLRHPLDKPPLLVKN